MSLPSTSGPGLPGIPGAQHALSQPRIVVRPGGPWRLVPRGMPFALIGRTRLTLSAIALFLYAPARAAAVYGGAIPTAIMVAAQVALVGFVVFTVKATRIEWDGQRVTYRSPFARREIGAPATGQIVRAQLSSPLNVGVVQYWLDASGQVAARLPEVRWAPDALDQIAEEAHIPVTELGELSPVELAKRYPAILPRYAANLGLQR